MRHRVFSFHMYAIERNEWWCRPVATRNQRGSGMRHTLSVRDALNIAAQHGLSIRHSQKQRALIRDCIIMAREASRRQMVNAPRKTAIVIFDGYMSRVAAEVRVRP
jgi:hypothetical protein